MARRPRKRGLFVTLLIFLLVGVPACGAYFWLEQQYKAPGPQASASIIEVGQGASVRSILAQLEAEGTVRDARIVEWYLRVRGLKPRVQAGRYEIPAHASPEDILTLFAEGKVILEQLTVVEGATFQEFLDTLAQHPSIAHTLAGKTPAQIMAALGHPGEPAEGEFFPDTYRFAAATTDLAILELAYAGMQRALAAAWQARSPQLPFDTPYQALILASMVEKEAVLKSERAKIAGVFVNRLRKGMLLQSDPTVIYGLGGRYDGSIHSRDLHSDTPSNTYTRAGLPPTPIALPGRESLTAAVQPESTTALYFVATGLGDGAHHFSSTYEEHNTAVDAYLARLRAQERGQVPASASGRRGTAHP